MYSYANVHSGLRATHGFSHSEPFNSDMAVASRESRQSFAVEWLHTSPACESFGHAREVLTDETLPSVPTRWRFKTKRRQEPSLPRRDDHRPRRPTARETYDTTSNGTPRGAAAHSLNFRASCCNRSVLAGPFFQAVARSERSYEMLVICVRTLKARGQSRKVEIFGLGR